MARIDSSLWPEGGGRSADHDVPLTLAQARDRLDRMPDLPKQKKADLRSAINTIGRALDLPLEAIPSTPAILRARLEKVSPMGIGISKQSWANTRSRLRKALDLTGVTVMAGRSVGLLAPAWQSLRDQIADPAMRTALSRFFGYCTANGIDPGDVTAGTFETFYSSIELQSLRARHKTAFRNTCKAWNEARRSVPGWPDIEAEIPDHRNRYALPWASFPASLKADIDAMVADVTGRDIINMKSPRRIKPQSALRRVENLQRLVSGYVLRGGDPADLQTLADVVRLHVVREGLRFHLERAGGELMPTLDIMVISVLSVARQWVGVDTATLVELKHLRRSVMTKQDCTMAPETRALLRQFDDERRLAALLNAPSRVLRHAISAKRLNRSEAVEAQEALAVQLLLDAPVRIGNLASVDLDRHVLRSGGGRARRVHLYFPAAEVKNDRELELPLTAETVDLLDLYVEHIRPRLVRSPNSFLFPGEANGPKGSALLSNQIGDFMHAHVGVRVTAHKFRHLIGYLYLKQNPGAHEVVRQLLGHKSIATTIRFYASLEQDEAFELYDSFLDDLRSSGTSPAKTGRKRR
jgi:integrase